MKSVAFVSTHKCATSLFSGFLLWHVEGLQKCDYQETFYKNEPIDELKVESEGYVYGVLRVHEKDHPMTPMTDKLLFELIPPAMKAVFLIRDPRDILVSMYYSFGFKHPFSQNDEIQHFQLVRRQRIQALSLDDFCIEWATDVNERLDTLWASMERQSDKVLVKYEDMVHRFDQFYQELNSILPFEDGIREQFKERTRPREAEDVTAHKRSGKTGDHLRKLKPETIRAVNGILEVNLQRFGYPPA